jgi:hypothetical protein
MLLSNEFHENWRSEYYTLLEGIKLLHILQNFCSIWMKLGTDDVHSELLSDQLHGNQQKEKSILYLGTDMNFCLIFSHLLSDLSENAVRDVHIMMLSSESHENQCMQGCTLLMGVMKSIYTCITKPCDIKSKENLGKTCVLCHGSTPFAMLLCRQMLL